MEPNQTTPVQAAAPAPVVTPVIVPPKPTKTSYGALIGIIVVTVAIASGAFFLFTARVDELIAITEEQQAAISALDTQSESTEPEAISADLESGSPDEFDAELDEAFAGLDASFATE